MKSGCTGKKWKRKGKRAAALALSAVLCAGGLVPASYGIVNAANENGADSTSGKPETEEIIIERWTWDTGLGEEADDLIVWSDENQRWEAAFPGANEENPVTEKHLKELLPGGILVETEDVEDETESQTDDGTLTETQTDTEPDAESQTESDTEPDIETQPQTESESDAGVQTEPQTETELQTAPQSGTEPQTESDAGSDTEPQTESGAEPQIEPPAESGTEAGVEADSEAGTVPPAESKSAAEGAYFSKETVTAAASESGSSEAKPESGQEPEAESVTEIEPEPEATTEMNPETEAESDSVPETGSAPETESKPETMPETSETLQPETTPETSETSEPEVQETAEPETEPETTPETPAPELHGEKIPLEWDFKELPETGIFAGEYEISAQLPEGYVFAQEGRGTSGGSIEVTLLPGGAMEYIDQDILDRHIVEAANPGNVTVNLFDYSMWKRPDGNTDADQSHENHNGGINRDHALVFTSYGSPSGVGNGLNQYRYNRDNPETGGIKQGIVKEKLDAGGYPELNLGDNKYASYKNDWTPTDAQKEESLSYLFDPEQESEWKESYEDVKGLFQYNEKGYYEYDSENREGNPGNFAELRSEGGENYFVLYDNGAVYSGGASGIKGQFFPFNQGREVFKEEKDGKLIPNEERKSNQYPLNHYFGMSVEVDFQQPANGMVGSGASPEEMKFHFSGDDDVWIFIDDVLVADLGGIRDRAETEINFATGGIEIRYMDGGAQKTIEQTNLAKQLRDNGVTDGVGEKTLEDGSLHTLKMFYLERGAYDSNLWLTFNLLAPEADSLVKVDQNGNRMQGVEFELYRRRADAANDGNPYDLSDFRRINAGSTDENGRFALTENGKPLVYKTGHNMPTEPEDYFILKEVGDTDGYMTRNEIHLYYDGDQLRVDEKNQWETGVTSVMDAKVTVGDGGLQYVSSQKEPENSRDGMIVAVPLYNAEEGKPSENEKGWHPLYGSISKGFYTESAGTDQREQIIRALYRQLTGEDYRKWAIAWDGNAGTFLGNLENLPGSTDRYIYVNPDDGDLLLAYYFVPDVQGGSLAEKVETLVAEAEKLGEDGFVGKYKPADSGFGLLDDANFQRFFSADIRVPNMVRELQVIKQDWNGKPIVSEDGKNAEAVFALFESREEAKKATAENYKNAAAYGTTKNGVLSFSVAPARMSDPSATAGNGHVQYALRPVKDGKGIQERYLWLKEIKAPDGYAVNNEIIPVVVTEDSVYAYAGDQGAEDGVLVRKGIGQLAQNMMWYATEDELDSTLRDVTLQAHLRQGEDFVAWDAQADQWGEGDNKYGKPINLHYGLKTGTEWGYFYGTHPDSDGKIPRAYAEADSGWLGFELDQNYNAHKNDEKYPWSNKTNLTGKEQDGIAPVYDDTTDLYTAATGVIIRDKKDEPGETEPPTETETETGTEPPTETETETGTEPPTETETETGTEPPTETESPSEPETESPSGSETPSEPDKDPDKDPDREEPDEPETALEQEILPDEELEQEEPQEAGTDGMASDMEKAEAGQTGDSAELGMWAIILVISAIGLISVICGRKRK